MLCFDKNSHGEICSNRCEKLQDCKHKKRQSYRRVPFLVEAVDRLVSEIQPEIVNGLPIISYKHYGVAPQAFENGFSEELSPTQDAIKKNKSFYRT